MKIKKGDTVQIISGKDKGKKGKVIRSLVKEDKIVVEGLNVVTKHVRPKKSGEKGQRIKMSTPLHVSKVMLICPHCKKKIRVGYKILTDNRKKRICRKCNDIF